MHLLFRCQLTRVLHIEARTILDASSIRCCVGSILFDIRLPLELAFGAVKALTVKVMMELLHVDIVPTALIQWRL